MADQFENLAVAQFRLGIVWGTSGPGMSGISPNPNDKPKIIEASPVVFFVYPHIVIEEAHDERNPRYHPVPKPSPKPCRARSWELIF
jgi:hypothetical protein